MMGVSEEAVSLAVVAAHTRCNVILLRMNNAGVTVGVALNGIVAKRVFWGWEGRHVIIGIVDGVAAANLLSLLEGNTLLLELGIDERVKLGINLVDGEVIIRAGIIRGHWVVGGMMLGSRVRRKRKRITRAGIEQGWGYGPLLKFIGGLGRHGPS